MTAAVLEAASCPTACPDEALRGIGVPKRNIKTKLQINTSPAAVINTMCAPSMGEGIERYRIIPEGVSPLLASW